MTRKATQRDTGFAWVILVISYLNNVITASVFTSAAIYMVDWIEEFDITKAEVGLAASIYGGVSCFTGIFVGPMVNKFGCKAVSILGTTIAVIGFLLSTFATSIWWLYISYGVLIGIGHAFYFIPPILMVQYYFDKRRPLAAGLSLAGHSSGSFIMMPLLNLLVANYGWRGGMLLQTGLVMQMYVFAFFYKKPNLADLEGDNKETTDKVTSAAEKETRKDDNPCKKTLTFFQETWNCNLLRNPVFLQLLGSVCFAQGAIDIMYRFSSIKAVAAGVDRMRASFLPSVIGLSSTCTRLVISFVVNIKCVNRTLLCGTAIVGQGCFVILSCFSWNFETLVVSMVLFGVCLGTHMTLSTTVTVDLLGIGSLANAHSFISGSLSIAMISGLSLTGLMVDLTGDYDLPHYIYGSLEVFAGVLILTIPLTQRYQRKKQEKDNEEVDAAKQTHNSLVRKKDHLSNDICVSLHSLASIPGS